MTGFFSRAYRVNQGFTLVELMVAMVLGVFFLNGILQIFSGAKQTYRVQENLARQHENGRLALAFISQDVRMAGYWGCSNTSPITTGFDKQDVFFYKFGTALEGFEALPTTTTSPAATAWMPNLDPTFFATDLDPALGNSDVLTIRKANAPGFLVVKQEDKDKPLQLDATSEQLAEAGITKEAINKGLVAIVSKCTTTEAFQVTGISGNTLEHVVDATLTPGNKGLSTPYERATLHAVNTISYYVATNRNHEKLLYRRVGSEDRADELGLVDGVEQMQVLYGVDTDGNGTPNYYVTADDVVVIDKKINWANVVSVRISLLVASLDDNMADHPIPYTFNGEKKTPEDRKIRQVFTSTIALRNRLKL